MLFISDNTISTIVVQQDKTALLTIYRQKQVLHEKQYKTLSAAKSQETKLLKRYCLSCY